MPALCRIVCRRSGPIAGAVQTATPVMFVICNNLVAGYMVDDTKAAVGGIGDTGLFIAEFRQPARVIFCQ